jgi:hypothetical protein
MEKKILWTGPDHTHLLTIFRNLVIDTGIRKQETLIFSGCEGPCYSMATFFSFAVRDLNLDLYFAADSDAGRMWRLEETKGLGITARKADSPAEAKVVVLMSGLVKIPLEKTVRFVENILGRNGFVIGETVQPGLFEATGWNKAIGFNYLFEFSMINPTACKVEDRQGP